MMRPRIERRNGNEQRNSEKRSAAAHAAAAGTIAGAMISPQRPDGQPVDHHERQTADENLRPECKADQPAAAAALGSR